MLQTSDLCVASARGAEIHPINNAKTNAVAGCFEDVRTGVDNIGETMIATGALKGQRAANFVLFCFYSYSVLRFGFCARVRPRRLCPNDSISLSQGRLAYPAGLGSG